MNTHTTESILEERGKTHGDFSCNSNTSQWLKTAMRATENWDSLANSHREAIDMICHKLGRIGSGNPNEPDHWRDIAGYATLVSNILTKS